MEMTDFSKRTETIKSISKLLRQMNTSETYFYINNIALDMVNGDNGKEFYQLLKSYFEPTKVDS